MVGNRNAGLQKSQIVHCKEYHTGYRFMGYALCRVSPWPSLVIFDGSCSAMIGYQREIGSIRCLIEPTGLHHMTGIKTSGCLLVSVCLSEHV